MTKETVLFQIYSELKERATSFYDWQRTIW